MTAQLRAAQRPLALEEVACSVHTTCSLPGPGFSDDRTRGGMRTAVRIWSFIRAAFSEWRWTWFSGSAEGLTGEPTRLTLVGEWLRGEA